MDERGMWGLKIRDFGLLLRESLGVVLSAKVVRYRRGRYSLSEVQLEPRVGSGFNILCMKEKDK